MSKRDFRKYLKQKDEEKKIQEKNISIIKECYEKNLPIPFHLKKEALNLMDHVIFENKIRKEPKQLYLTTSRDPSSKLRQFVKHLSLIFNGISISRGNMTIKELCDQKLNLIIIGETKGNASSLILTFPNGPTFYFSIHNLFFMRRERSIKRNLNLILENFNSEIGNLVKNHFSLLFPFEKEGKRNLIFINKDDLICVRHFFYEDNKLIKDNISFDMKLYKICKGTLEFEGDPIFSLKNFINTSGKNPIL